MLLCCRPPASRPGGSDPPHNGDNSVEKNGDDVSFCAPITIAPDESVVKTGPAQVTLGQNITYSITPEPSEVILLATGLLTLVGFQRARRRGRRDH